MGQSIARLRQLILLTADAALMFGALAVTLLFRYRQENLHEQWQRHLLPFGILFALWAVVLFINNAYDLRRAKNSILFFQNLLLSFLANFFLGLLFFYFVPAFRITPKTNLILVVLISGALIALWRALFNRFLGPSLLARNVLFLGYHPRVEELMALFENNPQIGYRTVALVDPDSSSAAHMSQRRVECFHDPMRIRSVVDIKDIHLVVIVPNLFRTRELEKELYELLFWRVEMADLTGFFEQVTGRVTTDLLSEAWLWQNLQESRKQYYDAMRSVFDVISAVVVGAIFAALLPLLALAIVAESGRPVFISQKRVGLRNKPFTIYKLRTMYAAVKSGLAETGAPQFSQKGDTRITRVGKWLRRFRIDELPQAYNVVRRDMNIIGPRPERPEFVAQLQERMPFYRVRHLIRPGITGWGQVNYHYGSTLEENLVKLEYDLYYMKNRSALLDVIISLKTVHILLKAMGR